MKTQLVTPLVYLAYSLSTFAAVVACGGSLPGSATAGGDADAGTLEGSFRVPLCSTPSAGTCAP